LCFNRGVRRDAQGGGGKGNTFVHKYIKVHGTKVDYKGDEPGGATGIGGGTSRIKTAGLPFKKQDVTKTEAGHWSRNVQANRDHGGWGGGTKSVVRNGSKRNRHQRRKKKEKRL